MASTSSLHHFKEARRGKRIEREELASFWTFSPRLLAISVPFAFMLSRGQGLPANQLPQSLVPSLMPLLILSLYTSTILGN